MAQQINQQPQKEALSSDVPQPGRDMENTPNSDKKVEANVAPRHIDKHQRQSCGPLLVLFSTLTSLFAGMISLSATAGQGMSKFYWHIPVLYGDKTAREWPEITGFRSGCSAGGKSLLYGFYDGITGVATLPYKGAKGAGIWAFIGHPIFGLHKYMSNRKQRQQQQDSSNNGDDGSCGGEDWQERETWMNETRLFDAIITINLGAYGWDDP
ncbi:hypothetical protein O1611_g5192 [Lasiodiplodia mahajangana]|uniref:Uncharacterized protein n=1 Tax=Lasiodiplodia mahajangana TaxID=1108764 RepID=A0ACC2JLU8_9PEZI|nr:hypothetical protein O1611_g5192 [Lasiodiplodia mahajangana]